MRGQAEYIAGLISLIALILVAYVAGSLALQLRELGLRLADEVYGSRESLAVVRINETHVEVRSGWDGHSEVVLMLLCDNGGCNTTSAKISIPRWSSATMGAPLNGNAGRVCVITAYGNMFCNRDDRGSNGGSAAPSITIAYAMAVCRLLPDVAPSLPRYYKCDYYAIGYNYSVEPIYGTGMIVLQRLNKVLLSPGYLHLQAYPPSDVMVVGEWDDIMDEVYMKDNVTLGDPNYNKFYGDPAAMFDHDDSTGFTMSGTIYPDEWNRHRVLEVDLGNHYDDGLLLIRFTIAIPGSTGIYVGDDLESPKYSFIVSLLGTSTPPMHGYIVVRFNVFGGGRYIWIHTNQSLTIWSLEFYPPEALNRTVIEVPADYLQGFRDYPLTVTIFATPDSPRWFRLIETTD